MRSPTVTTRPIPDAEMPAHHIAHYNLRLDRSLMAVVAEFYVNVVGLEIGPRPAFESYGIRLYADGRDLLHLSEEKPHDKRRIGRDLTFDHVAIECSNWPEYERRLGAANIEYDLGHVPDTDVRQVFFRDPAGNGVELIFKREAQRDDRASARREDAATALSAPRAASLPLERRE